MLCAGRFVSTSSYLFLLAYFEFVKSASSAKDTDLVSVFSDAMTGRGVFNFSRMSSKIVFLKNLVG